MKLVLNKAIGSCFDLSAMAVDQLCERKGWNRSARLARDEVTRRIRTLQRGDQDLIDIVESLGASAAGTRAELEIVDIPDGCNWRISDVVGFEFIEVNGKIF
jgi:hypothetical protein